jgi:hypothetical protein
MVGRRSAALSQASALRLARPWTYLAHSSSGQQLQTDDIRCPLVRVPIQDRAKPLELVILQAASGRS